MLRHCESVSFTGPPPYEQKIKSKMRSLSLVTRSMKEKNNTHKKGRSAKHHLQPHDTRNLSSKTKSGKQTTDGSEDKTRVHCQQIQCPSGRAHHGYEKLVTKTPHEELSMYDEEVESPGGHAQIDPLHFICPSHKSSHPSDFFSAKEHSQELSAFSESGVEIESEHLGDEIVEGDEDKSLFAQLALESSGPTTAPTVQDDFLNSVMGAVGLSTIDKNLWNEHVLAGGPDDPPLLECATTGIQRPPAQHVSAPCSENGVDLESERLRIQKILEELGEEDESLFMSFSHEWLGPATTTTPDDCHNSGVGVARLPHEEAFGRDSVLPQMLDNPSIMESAPTDYPASSRGKYSPQAAQHELSSGVTDSASLALGADNGGLPPPVLLNQRQSNDHETSCILRSIDIVCEQGAFSTAHNKEIYLKYLKSLLAEYLATPKGVERTNLVRQIHLKLTEKDGRKFLKRDFKCEKCRKKERGAGGCVCLWRHLSAPQTNTKKPKSKEELRVKAERDKIVDTFRYLEQQQASKPPTGTFP